MRRSMKIIFFLILIVGFFSSCHEQKVGIVENPMMESPDNGAVIPGRYIIVLHSNVITFRKDYDTYEEVQAALRKELSTFWKKHKITSEDVGQIYASTIDGFSAKLDPDQYAKLKSDPQVSSIEEDRLIVLHPHSKQETPEVISTQVVPYGIKRVRGGVTYSGKNVVFVLDIGIDVEHPDLNVEDHHGFNAFHDKTSGNRNNEKRQFSDGHGHGTHVAGTIAAIDNEFGVIGVAAGAKVVPVKVLDDFGRGSISTVVAGIDFVGHRGKRGDVANMSIGGPPSLAVDQAVINASEKKGIWFVIAAGNSSAHSNSMSPQRVNGKYIITVASINSKDHFSRFSNYGRPPVDFAAPGEGVLSTGLNGSYYNSSGTSMAAPHISGLRLLGEIDTDGYTVNARDGDQYPIGVRKF